ncbi:hypothetical protein BT67DRAFT_452579 [Trichocladium antarcticum]|uniref:Uncharacterized protein n=1 Tax=Trichocladium antarcticum TaxID=1450529 RepID=A0AAN6UC47_9PEZI|nr:hypothetical protein BT67DRAFT_452579 [Trichocladium antarcticum]
MEGQNQLINLTPYIPHQPRPWRFQRQKLTRHSFLSNRWGLQRDILPLGTTTGNQSCPPLSEKRATPRRAMYASTPPMSEMEAKIDHNFGVLRLEFHGVGDQVRNLARTVETISDQLTERINDLAARPVDDGMLERMERAHAAELASLETQRRLEAERLRRDTEASKGQLEDLAQDLQHANTRADEAVTELMETQMKMEAYAMQFNKSQTDEDPDTVVRAAFLSLRESILAFSRGSSLQLGPLSDAADGVANFCPPDVWNRASAHQRRRRVMAQVFYLLFRRILRPGLRVFALQAFIKSSEHHAISTAELVGVVE